MYSDLSDLLKGMAKVFERKVDFPYAKVEKLMTENPERLLLIIEKKEGGYYSTVYVKEQEQK